MSFWDRLLEELRTLGELIVEWAILIAAALLVLIIGRIILRWVRKLIERVLGAAALDSVWDRSGITRALQGSDQTPASITATVVNTERLPCLTAQERSRVDSIWLIYLRLEPRRVTTKRIGKTLRSHSLVAW